MLNFFRKNNASEDNFELNLKRKGLKALKNKRARLRERVAFAATENIRQNAIKLLRAVEDEIKSRKERR